MQDTRNTILNLLRERGQANAAEIADSVGLTPVSAHYHLSRLERDGLISVQPVRHGVGRPKFVYSLTETALDAFPQSTHRLADRLLGALKTHLTDDQIQSVFNRMVEDIVAEHGAAFADQPIEQKIETLVAILGEEGFSARVKKVGNDFQLTQCGCPYQYVVSRHPGICAIDMELIHSTLGANVERETWILNGDNVCTFHVKSSANVQE